MRTVTFSDPRVADHINRNFIPVWFNRGPGFHNEEKHTERSIFEHNFESYPTRNICTFFLKPDGSVYFYVAGYYAPDFFFDILMSGGLHSPSRKRYSVLAGRCSKAMAELQASQSGRRQFNNRSGMQFEDETRLTVSWCRPASYEGIEHRHSPSCLASATEGFRYLETVFRWFSEQTELPQLKDVRTDYLFGNPFTEESPNVASVDLSALQTSLEPEQPVDARLLERAASLESCREKLRGQFDYMTDRLCNGVMTRSERLQLQNTLVPIVDEMRTLTQEITSLRK